MAENLHPAWEACSRCNGYGMVNDRDGETACHACGGDGIERWPDGSRVPFQGETIECPECRGRGQWLAGREDASGMLYEEHETCGHCEMSGRVPREDSADA